MFLFKVCIIVWKYANSIYKYTVFIEKRIIKPLFPFRKNQYAPFSGPPFFRVDGRFGHGRFGLGRFGPGCFGHGRFFKSTQCKRWMSMHLITLGSISWKISNLSQSQGKSLTQISSFGLSWARAQMDFTKGRSAALHLGPFLAEIKPRLMAS